jgi:hypothetical protein
MKIAFPFQNIHIVVYRRQSTLPLILTLSCLCIALTLPESIVPKISDRQLFRSGDYMDLNFFRVENSLLVHSSLRAGRVPVTFQIMRSRKTNTNEQLISQSAESKWMMLRNYRHDLGFFVQCAEEFEAMCSHGKSYAEESRIIGVDEITCMK